MVKGEEFETMIKCSWISLITLLIWGFSGSYAVDPRLSKYIGTEPCSDK